jgi:hypothetical protein
MPLAASEAHRQAAADVEHLAGDEARFLIEKEAHRLGDIIGGSDAPCRYALNDSAGAWIIARVVDEEGRRLNRAGSYSIDGDAMPREFQRPGARDAMQRRLARGISRPQFLAERRSAGYGRHAAEARASHPRGQHLHALHGGAKVKGQHRIQISQRDIVDGRRPHDTDGIDEPCDDTVPLQDSGDGRPRRIGAGEIDVDPFHEVTVFRRNAIKADDPQTIMGQTPTDGATDVAGAAGYQNIGHAHYSAVDRGKFAVCVYQRKLRRIGLSIFDAADEDAVRAGFNTITHRAENGGESA